MKEPKLVDGPTLSIEVYRLALERTDALIGCTEDSPEEAELIHWAEIADAHERTAAEMAGPAGVSASSEA